MMKNKKTPMRRCIGCGVSKDKKELLRIVKTGDGEIKADKTGRANGRGAYICNNPECLEKAIKNHGLERSFKEKVDMDIYEKLKEEIL